MCWSIVVNFSYVLLLSSLNFLLSLIRTFELLNYLGLSFIIHDFIESSGYPRLEFTRGYGVTQSMPLQSLSIYPLCRTDILLQNKLSSEKLNLTKRKQHITINTKRGSSHHKF